MPASEFHTRLAGRDDMPALTALMDLAIGELLKQFLDDRQIAASRNIMGLDTQLIDDGTYFVVEENGVIAGCGGWSRRATTHGGDHSAGRSDTLLDPAKDAARVRAMYTHPDFKRRGVGRLILSLCENAAKAEGFSSVMLVATLAGAPLYRSCGYQVTEDFFDESGGTAVPLFRMTKRIG
jgi:GNAT superfamily N-acetyltransferase